MSEQEAIVDRSCPWKPTLQQLKMAARVQKPILRSSKLETPQIYILASSFETGIPQHLVNHQSEGER